MTNDDLEKLMNKPDEESLRLLKKALTAPYIIEDDEAATLIRNGCVIKHDDRLCLTDAGRKAAIEFIPDVWQSWMDACRSVASNHTEDTKRSSAEKKLDDFVADGYLTIVNDRYRLTERGRWVATLWIRDWLDSRAQDDFGPTYIELFDLDGCGRDEAVKRCSYQWRPRKWRQLHKAIIADLTDDEREALGLSRKRRSQYKRPGWVDLAIEHARYEKQFGNPLADESWGREVYAKNAS